MKYLFSLISLLFAFSSQAQVYQCEENGQTIFSDTPCDASTSAYGSTKKASADNADDHMEQGKARLMNPEESGESFLEERARTNKKREVADLRSDLADLKEEMEDKLSDLRLKQAQITHNLEHTTTDPEINKEIGETRENYRSRIREKREALLEAEKELRKLLQ